MTMKIIEYSIVYLKNVFRYFHKFATFSSYKCRLENIDTNKATVQAHFQNIIAPVRMSFYEAVYNTKVILNLSPIHACWFGYYYGQYYQKGLLNPNSKSLRARIPDLLHRGNPLTLVNLSRGGTVTYRQTNTSEAQSANVFQVVKNKKLIAQFDSTQSFYIGMQAGILSIKKSRKKIRVIKPIFRVIK